MYTPSEARPDKDDVAARHVLGRSLEPAGNGRSRKMITQRHNPAYRFACIYL